MEPLDGVAGDTVREAGAEEVAPGLYLAPRDALPRLGRVARVEVLYDPTVPGLAAARRKRRAKT